MAKKTKVLWPGWFYGPDDWSGVFQSQDEVPAGWEDHPSKVKSAAIAPESGGNSAEGQAIEIIEAKKADNSAAQLSASAKTPKPRGRPRKS